MVAYTLLQKSLISVGIGCVLYSYAPPPLSCCEINALVRTTGGVVSVEFWGFSVVLAWMGGAVVRVPVFSAGLASEGRDHVV